MKKMRFKDLALGQEFLTESNKHRIPNTYVKTDVNSSVLKFNEELGDFPFFPNKIVFVID